MADHLIDFTDAANTDQPTPPPPPTTYIPIEANWARAKITLSEGTQNQPLVVLLSRALPFPVQIPFVVSGTATRGTDYTLTLLPQGDAGDIDAVPCGQGLAYGFINVNVASDGVAEAGGEAGIVTLERETMTVEGVTVDIIPGAIKSLTLAIQDPPVAPPGNVLWSFESDGYSFNEDTPPASTRVRVNFSAPLPAPVTMRFYTADGTATAPADYAAIDASGTLPAGSTTFTIPLSIVNDTTPEAAETFTVHGQVLAGPASNGATTATTVTINASDQPAGDLIAFFDDIETLTLVERENYTRVRIQLSAQNVENVFVQVSITPIVGDLQRLEGVFPGGTFGVAVVPALAGFADIFLRVPDRIGVQATMEYDMTIEPGSGYVVGSPDTVRIQALDAGAPAAVVSFRSATIDTMSEGGADVVLVVDVENGGVQTQPFSVELDYLGPAAYGTDFRVYQNTGPGGALEEKPDRIDFPAPFGVAALVFRPTNDSAQEATEQFTVILNNPVNCELGAITESVGTIIDNDSGTGGENLRPQFYFASDVYGQGPSVRATPLHQLNLIADLGPGVVFSQDVEITLDWYGDNVTESLDGITGNFYFPDGKVLRIPAGQRFGKLAFRMVNAPLQQQYVVVEMVSTNYGEVGRYDQHCRYTAVLLGSTDAQGLVPADVTPSDTLDDFKVYDDKIEVHAPEYVGGPHTIPLPYDRTLPSTVALFGATAGTIGGNGDADDLYNGVAIAAHLAQHLWLQRNGGSFGTTHVFETGVPGEEQIHYIEPAVRWLTRGSPVYISVYEQAANGPHPLLFSGASNDTRNGVRPGSICWGRNDPSPSGNTSSSMFSPSCTRDLYIVARGHSHKVEQVVWRCTQEQTFSPNSETWYRQAFTDNIHIIGFEIDASPGYAPAVQATQLRPFIERTPPTWTTRPKLHPGIRWIKDFTWSNADPTADPPMQFHMRLTGPGSWVITGASGTRAQEHVCYCESTGPVMVLAHSENLVGTGRTMLQNVSRPPFRVPVISDGSGAGCSHGLLAIVDNEVFGDHRWGTASDFHVYGHTGYVFVRANRHRGELNVSGTSLGYNRRMLGVLSQGAQDGEYVIEATPTELCYEYCDFTPSNVGSAFFGQHTLFTTRFCEVQLEDIDLDAVGTWASHGYEFSGCYLLDLLPWVQAVSGTPMNTNPANVGGGWSFLMFNPSPRLRYEQGAVGVNPLFVPLTGGPYGPEVFLPNRGGFLLDPTGGVRMLAGSFALLVGAACGSTRLGEHFLFANQFTSTIKFHTLTAAQRLAYNGRDI